MTVKQLFLITFSFFLLTNELVLAQKWISPCPRLFAYEGRKSNEPNKWYGIITLLTDTTLSGVWMRIAFDKPVISLGNWFGKVETEDFKEYLVKNPKFELKAHVPQTVRFYVEHNPNEPAPQLVLIKLNARIICPEQAVTEAPPLTFELQTSSHLGSTSAPPAGGSNTQPKEESTGSDEDLFQGDFHHLLNRPAALNAKDGEEVNRICGTVISQPKPLITNGQATREGEFPWHVALYYTKGLVQMYVCGASLITKSHVVTAAHCITKSRSETPINPDNLVVYLGKYVLKKFTNIGIQDREVSEIIPHPMYNGRTYKNDIAVLKLSMKVDFTDYVRPICLWRDSLEIGTVIDKQGTVIGWGFDENGKLSEQLMQAKMPVVSEGTCIRSYPDFYSRFTSANTYCAGFRNGTSVCNGDSGGGMVFPRLDSKNINNPVWQLRGVVSISVALQSQSCDTSNYVVFTDVAKYLDWIRTLI